MDRYTEERDGQREFFEAFLPRINPSLCMEDVVGDNNDGVLGGNLLEFKLHVSDLNQNLFQCIKYLSALRMKGRPVPGNALIIDVNANTAWQYRTEAYLKEIECVYLGAASKENAGFIGGKPDAVFHYDTADGAESLVSVLKEQRFTKVHIDENCVVGWAKTYYNEVPGARKEDFIGDDSGIHKAIGEIRRPSHFAEYIYPYTAGTNVRFSYLMDKLNDFIQKKNLGAFYTPDAYADKSLELVRQAIARVPEGNDYIILDRCAGTGSLESGLSDEELSHCIVSTLEYYEYKVLQELLGSKVRHIIPPIETADTFHAGLVAGSDALSREYIENPVIRKYIDNPQCSVILFENPPYSEPSSIEHQKKKAGGSAGWKASYVMQEMRKDKKVKGSALNDLGNLFIWSAFHYYLRQPEDSYIVYSPVKYWKAQHLIDRKFLGGFAFNRRHFHTNIDACIMCALWSQEPDPDLDSIQIEAYDLESITSGKGKLKHCGALEVKRVYSMFSQKYYDKAGRNGDISGGILAEFDGTESFRNTKDICPISNSDIIGYLAVKGNNFDNPDASVHLLRVGEYDGHGFYLRRDNYLEKLPMFAASRYITYNREWTERSRIMKSADGAKTFGRDVKSGKLSQFLLKCLLFTCMEMQNHCRSFLGSDGIFYRNELCLDGSLGRTDAMQTLDGLTTNTKEEQILTQWGELLSLAKASPHYNPSVAYGVFQIHADLDTSHKDLVTGTTIWDDPELHSVLSAIRALVKDYYNAEIVPVLFDYEFLK